MHIQPFTKHPHLGCLTVTTVYPKRVQPPLVLFGANDNTSIGRSTPETQALPLTQCLAFQIPLQSSTPFPHSLLPLVQALVYLPLDLARFNPFSKTNLFK